MFCRAPRPHPLLPRRPLRRRPCPTRLAPWPPPSASSAPLIAPSAAAFTSGDLLPPAVVSGPAASSLGTANSPVHALPVATRATTHRSRLPQSIERPAAMVSTASPVVGGAAVSALTMPPKLDCAAITSISEESLPNHELMPSSSPQRLRARIPPSPSRDTASVATALLSVSSAGVTSPPRLRGLYGGTAVVIMLSESPPSAGTLASATSSPGQAHAAPTHPPLTLSPLPPQNFLQPMQQSGTPAGSPSLPSSGSTLSGCVPSALLLDVGVRFVPSHAAASVYPHAMLVEDASTAPSAFTMLDRYRSSRFSLSLVALPSLRQSLPRSTTID